MTQNYPKRLIEVDLPIKRISAHARREKSIRQGHISSLHIWWARRPLAACRAVICASLWLDPADPSCPQAFRDKAARIIFDFARAAASNKNLGATCDHTTWLKWQVLAKSGGLNSLDKGHQNILRFAMLDFLADFSDWNNSSIAEYLASSRALTQAAHEAVGGEPGTRPLIADPFAGGGSIPLEALRVGADAFASDLNPIPVLLNKVVLEYIPKYGARLSAEVRKWGAWIKTQAERELADFYPIDSDGNTPIAFLWARTIRCEGPGCGAEIPLIRTNSLFAKGKSRISLKPTIDKQRKTISFAVSNDSVSFSTIKSGTVTCPICSYTTANKRVMAQITAKHGGASEAILLAVVAESPDSKRIYKDAHTTKLSTTALLTRLEVLKNTGEEAPRVDINPVRPSPNARGLSAVTRYGMGEFRYLYSLRQQVTLLTLRQLVSKATEQAGPEFGVALGSCLALAYGRLVDRNSTLCRWIPQTGAVGYTFGRQALSMIWDYVEINPLIHSGGWTGGYEDIASMIDNHGCFEDPGQADQFSATAHPLADDCVSAFITDPPYYDAIPYADLSDFFYVWLRPLIAKLHPALATETTTPKEEEAIWNPGRLLASGKPKDEAFYETQMQKALLEGKRITMPGGIGVVVFAHKSTAGWEALLSGMLQAGWIVTASWPIDTEREARTNAIGTASLASSVHLVCRPRSEAGSNPDAVGDWRDILQELPPRIQDWMPRLAGEGVVGADAIFACLGPALEVFSRYSRVEKANGERVELSEYLQQVWAVVAREALNLVFDGADVTGFEPDARLTAMWLWTLKAPESRETTEVAEEEESSTEEPESKKAKVLGYTLEYDAARKIAQGLGADLAKLTHLVEISGDEARLLSVSERAVHLFGRDQEEPSRLTRKKSASQMNMFAELTEGTNTDVVWKEKTVTRIGETSLERVHQAMTLFAAGRTEALKRFVVEDGVGQDTRFWRLLQALSALYPSTVDEKRWVDGVLARKRQLGF